MERTAVEYLANAFWQLPVLALGAWMLLRMYRPGPAAQYRIWVAVLALGLLLPLRGAFPSATTNAAADSPAIQSVTRRAATLSIHAVQSDPSTVLIAKDAPESAQAAIQADDHGWFGLVAAALVESVHRVRLSAAIAEWIVGLWLAVALWGLLRIALAWRAARLLVANSRRTPLDERQRAALADCAQRVGVKIPQIRESDGIGGPVIVGAAKPVLLWPKNFAMTSEEEMRAALCHELAHVRRWDYPMNLVCELAALPLKWHPATHNVERRIRATREMACDAVAAEAMDSERVYAECLVRLARSIVGGGATEGSLAAGLFNGNVMEERVMRLMREKSTASMRAKVIRGAAGAAAMLAAVLVAAAIHLTLAMAQEVPVLPSAPTQAVPAAPPAPAQVVPTRLPARVQVPANVTASGQNQAMAPAPPKPLAVPVVPISPPEPTALTPVVKVVAKVPPVPLVPAVSAIVSLPPAPIVLQQAPVSPKATVPPQTHTSKPIVIKNGQLQDLTPEERARVEKRLADAQSRIAAATAKINSPEFRKQMEDAQAAALRAQTMFNSAEFQKKMADAQKQIADATAKLNSPEFQRRIQAEIDAATKVNSKEFQKQIEDAQAAALRAQTMLNSAKFQKQMADAQKEIAAATAQFNSPEFKKQIEDAARTASKVNSAEFQKQMADAQKQLADAMARMKAEQQKDAAK